MLETVRFSAESSLCSQREVNKWEVGGLKVKMSGDNWDLLKLQGWFKPAAASSPSPPPPQNQSQERKQAC